MTIKLDNPQIENFFTHELHSDIKAFSEFILKNLEHYKKQKEFDVVHLDPAKNSYSLEFDESIDVQKEDNPFKDIEDVAKYSKILREKSWR